jgi:hypothetical protein
MWVPGKKSIGARNHCVKGCAHLRHDLRYNLRFGACVIMTMHSIALT